MRLGGAFHPLGTGRTGVKVGADVDVIDNKGWTPLHFAFYKRATSGENRYEVVVNLLNAKRSSEVGDLRF